METQLLIFRVTMRNLLEKVAQMIISYRIESDDKDPFAEQVTSDELDDMGSLLRACRLQFNRFSKPILPDLCASIESIKGL